MNLWIAFISLAETEYVHSKGEFIASLQQQSCLKLFLQTRVSLLLFENESRV